MRRGDVSLTDRPDRRDRSGRRGHAIRRVAQQEDRGPDHHLLLGSGAAPGRPALVTGPGCRSDRGGSPVRRTRSMRSRLILTGPVGPGRRALQEPGRLGQDRRVDVHPVFLAEGVDLRPRAFSGLPADRPEFDVEPAPDRPRPSDAPRRLSASRRRTGLPGGRREGRRVHLLGQGRLGLGSWEASWGTRGPPVRGHGLSREARAGDRVHRKPWGRSRPLALRSTGRRTGSVGGGTSVGKTSGRSPPPVPESPRAARCDRIGGRIRDRGLGHRLDRLRVRGFGLDLLDDRDGRDRPREAGGLGGTLGGASF